VGHDEPTRELNVILQMCVDSAGLPLNLIGRVFSSTPISGKSGSGRALAVAPKYISISCPIAPLCRRRFFGSGCPMAEAMSLRRAPANVVALAAKSFSESGAVGNN